MQEKTKCNGENKSRERKRGAGCEWGVCQEFLNSMVAEKGNLWAKAGGKQWSKPGKHLKSVCKEEIAEAPRAWVLDWEFQVARATVLWIRWSEHVGHFRDLCDKYLSLSRVMYMVITKDGADRLCTCDWEVGLGDCLLVCCWGRGLKVGVELAQKVCRGQWASSLEPETPTIRQLIAFLRVEKQKEQRAGDLGAYNKDRISF